VEVMRLGYFQGGCHGDRPGIVAFFEVGLKGQGGCV
jgi:hypothetical protein